jgi:hypothetical protein
MSNEDPTTSNYNPAANDITSVTTYVDGKPVKTVTTDPNTANQTEPRTAEYYKNKLQWAQELLDQNSDLAWLIERASKAGGGAGWEMDKFWAEYNKTKFALSRTKAQEEFDIGMSGPNADTYQVKVDNTLAKLQQTAARLGIALAPEEAAAQAQAIVRNGDENNPTVGIDNFFSEKFTQTMSGKTAEEMQLAMPTQGTASEINRLLKDTARSYGITLNPEALMKKTGEALGQGERWQEYMNGQTQFFREQAKLLFPKAANLFDQFTLDQIAEPYLSDAGRTLGLTAAQMDVTDPKWTAFLNGENGPLGRDEWMRLIKTDSKYGWDRSFNARAEAASIGDDLLAAFGMA